MLNIETPRYPIFKPPYLAFITFVSLILLAACSLPTPTALAAVVECNNSPAEQQPLPVIAPGTPAQATQWQVHQLLLNASQSYENPYTDVKVAATFNGPAGEELTVAGFWNGANEYVVRFTPPSAGEWSYSIASAPADSGLTRSGAFTASAAQPEERGFVRRDPANPYSFVYDNGDRYFMMGQTYYDLVRTACAGDLWQEGVDNSQQNGINKIRIFVHSLGFGPDHLHPDHYPPVFPFVNDNHDQLNIDYWKKVDEVVLYLANRGMVADLILFMKPYMTPDPLAFGSQEQDERYVRYILARYAAFPNVIWCLSNEWEYTGKDKAYWELTGAIVRNEDPWMVNDGAYRLVSIHNRTGGKNGGKFDFFESTWPVHATVQYGVRNGQFQHGDEWGNYSIVQNRGHAMPVVNDEYGYIGESETIDLTRAQHRRALWAIVAGGGYASAGDFRIFNDGPAGEPGRVIMTGHWYNAAEYGDIQRLVGFWTNRGIPYWQMEPQNELIEDGNRVYLLAEEGEEYVVYAAVGGEFTLTLPDGLYRVERFDPRSGKSVTLDDVNGGEALSLALPDARDWILHLRRAAP